MEWGARGHCGQFAPRVPPLNNPQITVAAPSAAGYHQPHRPIRSVFQKEGGFLMLTLWGDKQRFCDGMTRRGFLKIGAFGAGLTLADMLRVRAASSGSAGGGSSSSG